MVIEMKIELMLEAIIVAAGWVDCKSNGYREDKLIVLVQMW